MQQFFYGISLSRSYPVIRVKVLIVGCGYAGLGCAIECIRKGHEVVILDKVQVIKENLGDVLSLGPNAGRFVERWGLHEELWPICGHARFLHLHNYQGELINTQPLPEIEYGSRAYNGHRGQVHAVLYRHALELGAQVILGQNVIGYWENAETGKAGVKTDSGDSYEADLVVGADGVRSKARKIVLGYDDRPKSSGYAIYRAWFDAKAQGIDQDSLTDFMCKGEDVVYGWIGPDMHFITSCSQGGQAVSCVLTHKDDADIDESWSFEGKKEEVLDVVRGWDPRCAAVLSKAPSFVDWKLVYRDPLPTWISKGGHVVLIGDAAHPFLPTSVQCASQAIEDGVVLAVTLQLAGKAQVSLAVKAWEHLRYERVRIAQLMGESTRDKWHRASSDERGDALDLPRPEWLFAFDAEKDSYGRYAKVAEDIVQHGYTAPKLPA
ncbi:monooxygenase [Cyathus striatus]|nr:monooxygenase [Cyathus striatus]